MGSMSDLDVLIEQMVLEIGTQTFQLQDQQLRLFLNWLMDHSSHMKVSMAPLGTNPRGADVRKRFQSDLKTWLRSLPVQGLLWEYRIMIAEIGWWHDIDPFRLKMIIKPDRSHK